MSVKNLQLSFLFILTNKHKKRVKILSRGFDDFKLQVYTNYIGKIYQMLVIHSVHNTHKQKKPSCGIIKNLKKNSLMWYMVNKTQCYELQTKTSDLKLYVFYISIYLWRLTRSVNRARTIPM